ncbi:MAG TPA: hypothetical protein VJ826_07555 [Candidatus Polarisedimenticolaceae bacterium]|nr:hypothetical protein [Candidatus Polarisedimenticolaceae bacterium]
MNLSRLLLTTALVVSALPFLACNNDDNGTPSPATSLFGTFADESGAAGTVELVGTSPAPASGALLAETEGTPLTGQLRLGGQPSVALTGTLDATAGTISFGSANGSYALSGLVQANVASGSGTGPGGPAMFALFLGGTPNSVDTFCTIATCTDPPRCDTAPAFNFAVEGSDVLATGNVDGTVGVATGTSSASGVELTIGGVTANGTITGNALNGTWTGNGTSGTFAASPSQCLAARR